MFDTLAEAARRSRGAASVGAWAAVENAAAARRLSAMADLLAAKLAGKDSAERDQWCLDNWDAVSAEVAAAQQVSLGTASGELLVAWAVRERLPRVAEVFEAGAVSLRVVKSVVKRTRLVCDRDAMAKVDAEIAARIRGWGALSMAKQEAEIDYWVDRYDPAAVVRAESASRSRHVDVTPAADGSGICYVEAVLYAHDGEALDKRLDEMARGVCAADPRTRDQRRSAALGAMAAQADRVECLCGAEDCAAAQRTPSAVVIHVIAEEASLADDTPVALHGERPGPVLEAPDTANPLRERVAGHLLAPARATGPARTRPGTIVGGALLPGPVMTGALANTATIRWLVHPGDSPPEPRYAPSTALADFVRCRDQTCRFPGCDAAAYGCDLDHTIAYPVGPTQASNLKCLCRKHHLLKTFWGWRDVQHPDGTVVWTAPGGQTFTTRPGSRVLFPALCRPTAPVAVRPGAGAQAAASRGLAMPRRTRTRAQVRAQRIAEQRSANEASRAPRNIAPSAPPRR
ncbi:hypothetical protein FHR72_000112 [Mycolicibacterium iranicum]|uniref:DUF222 domain-containing protein n=1 Tax=Mycolicibacterium iranicum TaxID=912594 RepID=A0A839Q2V5_MYCIR|nr:HNH endonuclease signature motif containing protein [Mycolicibacterium iranicum]MBB2988655.1 hypothetical protein [Mycolicibacterium iranicum]